MHTGEHLLDPLRIGRHFDGDARDRPVNHPTRYRGDADKDQRHQNRRFRATDSHAHQETHERIKEDSEEKREKKRNEDSPRKIR